MITVATKHVAVRDSCKAEFAHYPQEWGNNFGILRIKRFLVSSIHIQREVLEEYLVGTNLSQRPINVNVFSFS